MQFAAAVAADREQREVFRLVQPVRTPQRLQHPVDERGPHVNQVGDVVLREPL